MIEFRLFEVDDIKELSKTAIDRVVVESDEDTLLKYAYINKITGPAFTGLIDDKPVCAAGLHLRKGNTGHLWSVFTKQAVRHKKEMLESLKTMLDIVIEENDIRKVVTESRIDFPASQTLIEHLNFIRQRRTFNNDYYFYKRTI